MNSASGGLRPTVGLRRPKKHAPRRRRPTPGASAPSKADFNRHRAFGRRPARRMNSASRGLRPTVGLRRPKKHAPRRRRPTPGAQRPRRPISIGTKASGQRSACADQKVPPPHSRVRDSLRGPSTPPGKHVAGLRRGPPRHRRGDAGGAVTPPLPLPPRPSSRVR